jgi:hypothetical protein
MIKFLIFSFAMAFTVASLAGCADNDRHSSTTDTTSSMTVDSKDMSHAPSQH